jgi:hypothetical protein
MLLSTDIQLNSSGGVYTIERDGLKSVPCEDGLSAPMSIVQALRDIPEFWLDTVYNCH